MAYSIDDETPSFVLGNLHRIIKDMKYLCGLNILPKEIQKSSKFNRKRSVVEEKSPSRKALGPGDPHHKIS
jgi:hypothetical protein